MPYIKPERREIVNDVVKCMVFNNIKADGDLNYILYTFAKYNIKPSYNNYKNFIGELNETISEIRRRILSKYEDSKIVENGDI